MDAINTLWLRLAKTCVIEVSPGQTPLIDASPPPSAPNDVENPAKGGWGQENPVPLDSTPSRCGPKKGYDVETREWRTTLLFIVPASRRFIERGPWRVRADVELTILEVKPVTTPIAEWIAARLT
jgi:hypothetical protein